MNEAAAALEKEKKTFLDEFRELILHQFTVKSFSGPLSKNYRDSPLKSDFEFFEGLASTPQIKFLISLPNKEIVGEYIKAADQKRLMGMHGNIANIEKDAIEYAIIPNKDLVGGENNSEVVKILMLKDYVDSKNVSLTDKISEMEPEFKNRYESLSKLSTNSGSSSGSSSGKSSSFGGKRKKKKTRRKTRRKKKRRKRRKTRKKRRKKR